MRALVSEFIGASNALDVLLAWDSSQASRRVHVGRVHPVPERLGRTPVYRSVSRAPSHRSVSRSLFRARVGRRLRLPVEREAGCLW